MENNLQIGVVLKKRENIYTPEKTIYGYFKEEEKTMILEAIINHRNCESNDLNAIIYKSDKLSRACYKCKAAKGCNWPLEKRNLEIKY